jgi:DNA polymerase III subunit beta
MDATIASMDLARALQMIPGRLVTADGGALGIHAARERATITAGNDQFGVAIVVPATVAAPASLTVSGKCLADLVAVPTSGPVQFTTERGDARVRIRCGHTRVHVATIASVGLAPPQVKRRHIFTVAVSLLREAITRVAFAAADDAERPVLTTVLWDLGAGGLTLTAADGFRLARARMPVASGRSGAWLMPAWTVVEIGHILMQVDGGSASSAVRVAVDQRTMHFTLGPARFWVHLSAGTYPNVDRVVPIAWRTRVTVERMHLLQAIRIVRAVNGTGSICAARFDADSVPWGITRHA